MIVNVKDGAYLKVREADTNSNYYQSDILDFYNIDDELVKTIDLTYVVNAQLLKTLAKAIFEK
jgi:adenylate cyclase